MQLRETIVETNWKSFLGIFLLVMSLMLFFLFVITGSISTAENPHSLSKIKVLNKVSYLAESDDICIMIDSSQSMCSQSICSTPENTDYISCINQPK